MSHLIFVLCPANVKNTSPVFQCETYKPKTIYIQSWTPGWSVPSLGAQSFCWFCHVAALIIFIRNDQTFTMPITFRSKLLKLFEPRHDKTSNVAVRPAKTQISLGIRPRLIWVFAGRTVTLLVGLSCRVSFLFLPLISKEYDSCLKMSCVTQSRKQLLQCLKVSFIIPAAVYYTSISQQYSNQLNRNRNSSRPCQKP